MMWIASSWPRVVIRPTFAPLRWISVLVPIVVPWLTIATSRQKDARSFPSLPAAISSAATNPALKSGGVDAALAVTTVPLGATTTQSVKVPPMSTPTRYPDMDCPLRSMAGAGPGGSRSAAAVRRRAGSVSPAIQESGKYSDSGC